MAKFKKVPPCVNLSSCGSSVGVGVSVLENVDGREVFVTKSSKDAFPEIPKSDAFSLENQLKSGDNIFDNGKNQFPSIIHINLLFASVQIRSMQKHANNILHTIMK